MLDYRDHCSDCCSIATYRMLTELIMLPPHQRTVLSISAWLAGISTTILFYIDRIYFTVNLISSLHHVHVGKETAH